MSAWYHSAVGWAILVIVFLTIFINSIVEKSSAIPLWLFLLVASVMNFIVAVYQIGKVEA